MTECTFHPDEHATAELNVHDSVVDDQIALPICDKCVERYDEVQQRYLKEQ